MIYLDNAATTKPCDEAIAAINNALINNFGNPSSLHRLGIDAENVVNEARKTIAAALVADPSCIYFTSGATESNNLAIDGIIENYGKRKKKIVTTAVEHPSVAQTISKLEKYGYEVYRVASLADGTIPAEAIVSAVDDRTCLVSCMLVNNENGYILPIKRAFNEIKRKHPDVITHCDAVQGFMKIPIKVSQLGADIISISAHKINGPKGIGAIYIEKGVRVAPQLLGGGQERKQRSGTESVPLIAGFGAAVKKKMQDINERFDYVTSLKDYLVEVLNMIPEVTVLSSDESSPYIVSIAVEKLKSETLLHFLESKNIFVSSGSACSKGAKSSVMKSFNVNERLLDSILRISMTSDNSVAQIDTLAEAIIEASENLVKIR